MSNPFNFNANEYEPQGTFDPIPAGWYMVQAKKAELKPTKNGAGTLLNIQMEVCDGEYKGRIIFERINYLNSNAQAQAIGRSTLSALCHCTGVYNITDPAQLCGIPLQARVVIQPAREQYEASNAIKQYRTSEGVDPKDIKSGKAQPNVPRSMPAATPTPQPAPAPTPAPTGSESLPPWMKQ